MNCEGVEPSLLRNLHITGAQEKCVYMLSKLKIGLCCGGKSAARDDQDCDEMGNDPSKRLLGNSLPQPLSPSKISFSKADFKVMWNCTWELGNGMFVCYGGSRLQDYSSLQYGIFMQFVEF